MAGAVMDSGLKIAIRTAGGMRSLGRKLGISHNAIREWDRVPYSWLIAIEKATGVPPHKLRPELYRNYARKSELRNTQETPQQSSRDGVPR